ncbi:PfkB family carbohydrate kinase [Streptomyces sp. NPDC060209]|uniref:PfkB family carbohydrate kinase n=1 Tax=Streptomyces sp. NPDC060209 TaxID=3347073 RepID=UPI00365BDBEF
MTLPPPHPGPRLVVITCGAQGATALTARHHITVPAPRTYVVDTIGAGDAFQSSLLDALLTPDGTVRIPATPTELEPALRRCVTAGAITCTHAGARPPTHEEIRSAQAADDVIQARQAHPLAQEATTRTRG